MPTNAEPKTYSALWAWAALGFTLLVCALNAYAGAAVGWGLYVVSVRRVRSVARLLLLVWLVWLSASMVAFWLGGHRVVT